MTTEALVVVAKRLATSPDLSYRQRERVARALAAYRLSRDELVDVVRARGAACPDSGLWRTSA